MMAEEISELKEAEKQEIQYSHNWIGGVVLITIGAIFLLSNLNIFHLNNWWALFILIPAVANFGNAWQSYRRHGRLTHGAQGSLTGGLILLLISGAFLFGWSWNLIWPIFLIIGGLSAIFKAR
jgi:hypothetical protein